LVWQAGRLETYRNTIFGLFSAIIKKNRKSFGRLQVSYRLDGSSEFSELCGEEQVISVSLGYHRSYMDQGGAID
jgi:hypothetical protein